MRKSLPLCGRDFLLFSERGEKFLRKQSVILFGEMHAVKGEFQIPIQSADKRNTQLIGQLLIAEGKGADIFQGVRI